MASCVDRACGVLDGRQLSHVQPVSMSMIESTPHLWTVGRSQLEG